MVIWYGTQIHRANVTEAATWPWPNSDLGRRPLFGGELDVWYSYV